MVTSKGSYFLILVIILALFSSSEQAIPTIVPDNSLLNAQSNYIMSYFSLQRLTTSSYFQIDFSQTDIAVNDGALNVSANLNGSAINSSTITSSCTNKICIIRLGVSVNANTNVQTTFGFLRNPRFTSTQRVTVFVFFAANSNQTQTVSLSSSIYMPMPVTVNSVTQSDFGVGSNEVTYTFNVSFSYIPTNPEISIQIPSQVGYTNIDTNLTFYGTYQPISPFLTTNMIIFSVQSAQIVNPNGFMLLTLSGFRNPRFIGNSNSFNVSMVQKRTSFSNNCVTCRVAYLYVNSSKMLIVSSTTPGDITMNMFNPSSYLVSQNISLTIGIKIVAPIPQGGKFRIILPTGITPSMPITCEAVYGFTVTNPSSCFYNETTNTIQTVNYSIPYLESTGDAIIKIYIINPKDNRQTYINFETLDDQNRKIGKSRTPFLYTAVPLTLNAMVSKNTTFIESLFTLSSNITLTQKMNVSSDLIVVTLPPSEYYNLTAIQCVVSSNVIPCTKEYDNFTKNLIIRFSPPCSPICSASTIIPFMINNLINPSFINDDMNSFQIQTISNLGVMQSFYGDIDLKQKNLNIQQLNWIGSQNVGSQYQLTIEYQIPRYISTFGGYLLINFDQNSTYLNLLINGMSSSYPQAVSVINEDNKSLMNTLAFYNTSTLWSLKQIKVKLCTSDSPCGAKLNITVLRKSFYPLQSSSMTIKCQTLNGEPISTSTSDTSPFMPQVFINQLTITPTISTTNTISTYIMKFKMNKLPFDSGLRIDLSTKHKIQDNGKCFVQMSPATVLGYGIDCKVLNSSSILLTYVGDIALMTAFSIDYTLTIVNVLNPPSIMPMSYKIQPTFNNIKVGSFLASYAIAMPYALAVAQPLILSNSTYGQLTNLTVKLSTGYYPFDQMKIYLPKENFKTFQSLINNGNNLTLGSYNVTDNGTYFLLEKIYAIDSTFTLKLTNALNTNAGSKIAIEMYVQGYLSSTGTFNLPKITPVYLYASVSSSNRYVGENASLTFDVRRINFYSQQNVIKIFFNNAVFTLPSTSQLFTTDLSNGQLYSYSQQLSSWPLNSSSKLLTLQSFQNMKFIPNSQTLSSLPKLNISTFDQSNSIVATTLVDLTDIVPNKFKDSISYTFTRTSNQSLNNTDIVIDFIPRYAQMAKLMKIELPLNENKFTNVSSCVFGDNGSNVGCEIVDMQSGVMTIKYPTITQSKITLKNVLNQFPSSNNLTVTLLTQQSQLIEQSSSPILPIIDFDPLTITGTANTSSVSSSVQLTLTITSPENIIDSGSRIKFTLPDKIYSRISLYGLKDCEYEISGVKFTGCLYENDLLNDGKEWLQYVTVGNFSGVQLQPGTSFNLTLYLANPWTAYPLQQKTISATLYNSLNQSVSKGNIDLTSIYFNLTAFTSVQLPPSTLQQVTKQCSSNNTLTFNITLPVNIATQSSLIFVIPKDYFIIVNQTGYEIEQLNSTHYRMRRVINECTLSSAVMNSGLCMKTGDLLTSTIKVTNQQYLKILNPKPFISIYIWNDNNFVTSSSDLALSERVPSSIVNTLLERSTGNVSQSVTSTVKFTLPSTFSLNTQLKLSISPLNSIISFIQSIQSLRFITQNATKTTGNSSSSALTSSITGKEVIISSTSNSLPSFDIQVQLQGVNPSYVSNLDSQSYVVKVFDGNFVYFVSNVVMATESKLKPLSEGLTLTRSTTLVNTFANYTATASLPTILQNSRLIFNQTTSIPLISTSASLLTFSNISIGQFLNPLSSNWDTYESISIMNDTHILYSNNRVKTLPGLTSLSMPINTISSVEYIKNMRVNTEQTLTVTFGSVLNNVDKVNIKLPTFFKSIKECRLNSQILLNCKFSALSSTVSLIQFSIPETMPTGNPSKLSFTILTQDYQTILTNESIIIETEYPTTSYQQSLSLNIWGTNFVTQLNMTSERVNDENDIELKIMPLMKNSSQIVVFLPVYLNEQIVNIQSNTNTLSTIKLSQGVTQKQLSIQFNPTLNTYFFTFSLNQSLVAQNLTLRLNNMYNPISNEPFYFVIEQRQSPSSNNIFGHSNVQVKMKTLQQIFVHSTQRNTSKIGVNVEITAQIQLPLSLKQSILNQMEKESCVIHMPAVQVVREPASSQCEIMLIGDSNNVNTSLPCQMHPTMINAIVTSCKPGINKYFIKKGYKNMLYSIIPNATHKPFVLIGSKYQLAESSNTLTPLMTPIMTSGSLNLNSLTSSSSIRLQKTTLDLNMTLENIQQVDFINFRFEKQNYLYSTDELRCSSNGIMTDCWSVDIGSIMVNISSIKAQNLAIKIQGLSNYLRQMNFTIRTLKYLPVQQQTTTRLLSQTVPDLINIQSAPETSFGLVDIFYSSPTDVGAPFTSNSYNVRVVVPENYVSSQQKEIRIFFDDENLLPTSLSKTLLKFNITSSIPSCQLLNADFSTSFTLSCVFNQSINFNLAVNMFDKSHAEINLAQNSFTTFIYPPLSDSCQNQMCDKCSTGQDGSEKCFSCRQNYYEHQNGCVQSCPNGFTSYDISMTCQQCSIHCATCYGLYSNNCIQCSNSTLVSDNGQCSQTCSAGYAENGYCIGDQECFDKGCRLCGTNGFCYECLPDYSGEPQCQWQQLLPSLFMSFFIAPFAVYAIISTIFFLVTKGALTMTNQVIFAFSLLEFIIWLFIIPALHTKQQAMVLLSLIILRIVIGIVAYETYYKKQVNSHIGVNDEESLLEQEKSSQKQSRHEKQSNKELQGPSHFDEDWKTRLIRFLAHTNGVDTYEEFKVLFMDKVRIQHNNLYLWLSTGNRLLVCVLMFYVLTQMKGGDLTIMPVASIVSSLLVLSLRLVKSQKFQKVWQKIRNPTK